MLDDRAPEGPRERDDDPDLHRRRSLRAAAECADAARGCPPRHLHHRRRAAQRRLLHARARPAARQEDGQPGRPDRLPPLLRRREGQRRARHHVLRVPGRAARPGRRRDGAHGRLARRLRRGARLLGAAARAARRERDRARRRRRRASRTPRACGTSSPSSTTTDEPLVARASRRSRRSTRSRASTACARSRPTRSASRALLEETLGFAPRGDAHAGRRAATSRGGFYAYDAAAGGAAASPAPAPSTTSPGRRRWRTTRPGASASPRRARARRR